MRADVVQAIGAGIFGVVVLTALVWAIYKFITDIKKDNDKRKKE